MAIDEKRKLAYIVTVDEVKPIVGYDRIELVRNRGWWCVCQKGMQVGDKAIYFEIDSLLPEDDERFKFCEKYHYRIKTQKMCKGTVYSQGLLIPIADFPEFERLPVGTDLTDVIGVKYYVPEDNFRKSTIDPNAKYKSMAARHPEIFKNPIVRWLMRRDCGKKFLFKIFGKKRVDDKAFPTKFAFVHKTDETRIESFDWNTVPKGPYIVTTKVDGSSATYILERKPHKKHRYEYYICSRNVRMLSPDQNCYHDTNVYWEMSEKYQIEDVLRYILANRPELEYVCLQGEIAGPKIQGNPHNLSEVQFFAFNYIDSEHGRWNSVAAKVFMEGYNIPWVPIVDDDYMMPETLEEFKLQADGPCEVPGSSGPREGYVYRLKTDPMQSFKNVSREYLLWKHE